jgi:hypothetical protein
VKIVINPYGKHGFFPFGKSYSTATRRYQSPKIVEVSQSNGLVLLALQAPWKRMPLDALRLFPNFVIRHSGVSLYASQRNQREKFKKQTYKYQDKNTDSKPIDQTSETTVPDPGRTGSGTGCFYTYLLQFFKLFEIFIILVYS